MSNKLVGYFMGQVRCLLNSVKEKSLSRKLCITIPELKGANVRIKNPNNVDLILNNMITMGKDRLQVVSDFDRTISLSSYNGQPCLTSNAVLELSRFVSPNIKKEFQMLRNHYLQIENDHVMSREEKVPFMIEWWTKSLSLVISTQINQNSIKEIVRNSVIHLKDGCKWFFYTLERYDIPLLIFSAGLGDIIQEWIGQECGSFKNMKIVSNFMTFDKENQVNGFRGQMIHIFNKNEATLLNTDYRKNIENRSNIILLGDSLGDVDMASGLDNISNVLKIGFLNDKESELLPSYMNAYDIVTIKDDTFNVPNAVLRSIL